MAQPFSVSSCSKSSDPFDSESRPSQNCNSELTRRLSDSDVVTFKRTHSNLSQCRRARAQTRNTTVEDPNQLTAKANRPMSFGHGPRPSPLGKSSDANDTLSGVNDANDLSRTNSISLTQSFDFGSLTHQDDVDGNKEERLRRREEAFLKLHSELERAHQELKLKDDQCKKLSRVRDDLDNEVEELTASLFEEANKMVIDAKTKQAAAEMQFKEASLKLEGLQAEVNALKLLVITSTPSNPGKKTHRRSPSADQICHQCQTCHFHYSDEACDDTWAVLETINEKEVDRLAYHDFVSWLEQHYPTKNHPFIARLEKEDVLPCLAFPNQELADNVLEAVKNNTLLIEAVAASSKPRRCALTKAASSCNFRIKLFDNGNWHFVSNGSRHRIVAVANLYTHLRYIQQGLIRKEALGAPIEKLKGLRLGEEILARNLQATEIDEAVKKITTFELFGAIVILIEM
eukprot:gene13039-14373_t